MSIASFDELYNTLKGSFCERDTAMRRCNPAEERIVVTLRQAKYSIFITLVYFKTNNYQRIK
jgi:hypothetical protein